MVRTYSSPGLPGRPAPVVSLPWWVRYKPSRVLFMDDMEGVLKWVQIAGTVSKDSTIDAFEGSNSLKMLSGATAGNQAGAQINLGAILPSQLMLQCRFHAHCGDATVLRSLDFKIVYSDGTNISTAVLRHLSNVTTPQNKWQYYTTGAAYADVPGGSQLLTESSNYHSFLRMKVDLRSPIGAYTLLECDNLKLALPNVPIYQVGSPLIPYLTLSFLATTDTANASTVYIDDVILSDLEP
jgi:hypothetical protein